MDILTRIQCGDFINQAKLEHTLQTRFDTRLQPRTVRIDETVLRTVGLVSVRTDNSGADEQQIGAFGIIKVSNQAVTAGAASIPGPITDIGDDGWLVHVPFNNAFEFSDATGFAPNMATNEKFDFKSKRIVEEGFALALMVESAANSEGFIFGVILRMLTMVKGTG